jgi:hypothetical protein
MLAQSTLSNITVHKLYNELKIKNITHTQELGKAIGREMPMRYQAAAPWLSI